MGPERRTPREPALTPEQVPIARELFQAIETVCDINTRPGVVEATTAEERMMLVELARNSRDLKLQQLGIDPKAYANFEAVSLGGDPPYRDHGTDDEAGER